MEVRRAGLLIGSELLVLAALGVFLGSVGFGIGVLGADPLPIAIVVLLLAGILGSLGWLISEEGVDEVREDPTPVAALLLLVGLLVATVLAAVVLVGQSLIGALVGLAAAGLLAGVVLDDGLESTVDQPIRVFAIFLTILVALLVIGAALGNVGFGGANLAVDAGSILVVSLIVGAVVGIAYVVFQQREAVQERAEQVAEDPRPVAGGAIVAVLSAALFLVALVLVGYDLVGFALGIAAVAALVALVVLTGPDLALRHPVLVVGAFAGLILLLFVLGTVVGPAALQVGGLDLAAGPIIAVILLIAVLVGAAWLGLRLLTGGDEDAPEEGAGEAS